VAAKVLDQNGVVRCLTSKRESRLLAWRLKEPKLLIFPFLVRTNDEGVFRIFLLGGGAGLPETVDERGTSRVGIRLTGIRAEQFGSHSRIVIFSADVL
jgi:hypothetical protein